MAKTAQPKPQTGTQRVTGEAGFAIPAPIIPPKFMEQKREDARQQPVAVSPVVSVASRHLVASLTAPENRMTRIRQVARENHDVGWLLEQYEKLKKD